jgi:Calx-beta domain-containing protein
VEDHVGKTSGRIAFLLAAFLYSTGAGATVIESAGQPWLRIGADGRGIVAYYDRVAGDAGVAHCVDAACSAVTRSIVDSAGNVGSRISMTIAPDGRPVLSYLDLTNGDLKVAFCGDAVCTTASTVVLDPEVGISSQPEFGRTAIAIGADGFVLVAYTDLEPGIPPPPLFFNDRLKIVHCEDAACATRTTTDVLDALGQGRVVLGIGGDGRAFVMWHRVSTFVTYYSFARCNDLACTSLDLPPGLTQPAPILPSAFIGAPSLAFQENGLPAYLYSFTPASKELWTLVYVRCSDAGCHTSSEQSMEGLGGVTSLSLPGGGALPRFASTGGGTATVPLLSLHQCQDAGCAAREVSCIASQAFQPSLATDPNGRDIVAFERDGRVEVRRLDVPGPASCGVEAWVPDTEATEGAPAAAALFTVTLAPPSAAPVTVAYQTVDGTARAGSDYVAQSGVLTIAPGQVTGTIAVPLVDDRAQEPTETFALELSAASGATLVDGHAVAVILDEDGPPPPPTVDALGCTVIEGTAGTTGCVFGARLSESATQTVTVQFGTFDGSATAGSDYLAQAGTLTFAPGVVSQTVSVPVVGDAAVELDESVGFVLSNLVNVLPGTLTADGWIVDDDAPSLSSIELTHGARIDADLASPPGPATQDDHYRFAQAPFSSYEVVVDGVSGDLAPGLVVERLAEDNATVRQLSAPVGVGSAVAMRWVHSFGPTELRQTLRVHSSACSTGCGPDDVYRLRFYETTASIPRFNNAGSQATVLILQNLSEEEQIYHFRFWDQSGAPIGSEYLLGVVGRETAVLNTAALPFLAGRSGSVTIAHEAGYGGIAGKAVSLEPATGLAFDTPLVYKPR